MSTVSGGESATVKICCLCGADVSGKPRTKDSHGRYYCDPCFNSALVRKKAEAEQAHGPLRPVEVITRTSETQDSASDGSVEDTLSMISEIVEHASPSKPKIKPCPGCAKMIPDESVLCVYCGYDFNLHTAIAKTRVGKPSKKITGGIVWPAASGIACMVFGSLGVLGSAWEIANAYSAGNAMIVIDGAISLFLSVLFMIGGYKVIDHDRSGLFMIRISAAINLVMTAMVLIGLNTMAAATDRAVRSDDSGELDAGGTVDDADDRGQSARITPQKSRTTAVLLVSAAIPPTLALVFFSIPPIRKDIVQWA
ncbi:MAG TPA: hypothetical protein VG711_06490 [Phycisphaerales bacterium]|nr:hypothetical protein [Phycisphaerales bacterium]